ncbi:gamma1-adaptin, partial [Neocallimastix californiae]
MDIQISNLINKFTALRLKDLIKAVRACKTAADERAVIAKESANIRTSFKEDDSNEARNNNISKLLYIHMLGYPAHFGQIECLKLVASPRFSDKRVGYLGIMLLLDENQEILTLVTNSLKNDLNHSNMYVVGLALCTLGNISSVEMARDLSNEVEKLLGSTSSYIRKKSALCALKIIKKVPELTENYIKRAKKLLIERHHGVLLTAITLLTEMCKQNQAVTKEISKYVPHIVKILRGLITNDFTAEHVVNNVSDPFLQVKILRLLRILGHKNQRASDAMNDILAQVVTNTEGSKNTGNAVLYEAVLTIIHIESENSLRVLAINILGRFLANSDNNIKYVALTTLTTVADTGFASTSTLQRHRKIILDCLKDVDISIRHRALDLSFSLLNSQNIRAMTRELLNYLEVAPVSEKNNVIHRICESASVWKPNSRWEIDTICRVLTISGKYVEQDIINHFVKLVSVSPGDLQQYITRKLYSILTQDDEKILEQEGLIIAGSWCIGEYGDMLVDNDSDKVLGGLLSEEADNEGEENITVDIKPSEDEVILLLNKFIDHFCNNDIICEYILTALAKLSTRLSTSSKEKCRSIISRFVTNTDMEIQQRAVEYNEYMKLDETTLSSLMERIPPLEGA